MAASKPKMGARSTKTADFFISYNHQDAATATWLRTWLEQDGHSTFMQEPDFPPTSHIPEKMGQGMKASRLLAVMSANYLASKFCRAELHAAFMRDPLNDSSGLVIVRIDGCDVPDLYQPISRIELVGLAGEQVRTFFLGKIRELPPATRPKRKPNSTAPASTTPLTIPPPATTNIQALGDRSIAAGRDVHVTYRESSKPRGRAKPPADVITEEQAVRLKQLVDELIELDRTEYGADLTEAQLRQKWWGALLKKVPATTYTNYSQRKFQRALKWCREQRGRLVSGQQEANPSAFRQLATRAIHAFITSRKLDKLTYYAELSRRLEIEPAFVSTTKLSDANLRRVYGAVQRDTRRS